MPGPVRVKICGLTTPAAVEAAAAADWVGFVFYPPSPRFVTPARAAVLAEASRPARVGLFVDPSDDAVADTLASVRLDVLQVVASPARAAALRGRFGLPVWRAVAVAAAHDLPVTMQSADGLLLDAKAAPDATRPGGNGDPFDWGLLRGWAAPGPWLLAGGLRADNVNGAIAATGARAVDVSSGVETAPGVKDPARIAAFLAAVQSAGAADPPHEQGLIRATKMHL